MRRSKKTDRECYVLEAVRPSEPVTIRFSFNSNKARDKYLPVFQIRIARGFSEILAQMMNYDPRGGSSASKRRQGSDWISERVDNSHPQVNSSIAKFRTEGPIEEEE